MPRFAGSKDDRNCVITQIFGTRTVSSISDINPVQLTYKKTETVVFPSPVIALAGFRSSLTKFSEPINIYHHLWILQEEAYSSDQHVGSER
jgi:hypothetical protein